MVVAGERLVVVGHRRDDGFLGQNTLAAVRARHSRLSGTELPRSYAVERRPRAGDRRSVPHEFSVVHLRPTPDPRGGESSYSSAAISVFQRGGWVVHRVFHAQRLGDVIADDDGVQGFTGSTAR